MTSPKLERLRARLVEAEINRDGAQLRLEEVKASLQTYPLLVQLYPAGLLKEK